MSRARRAVETALVVDLPAPGLARVAITPSSGCSGSCAGCSGCGAGPRVLLAENPINASVGDRVLAVSEPDHGQRIVYALAPAALFFLAYGLTSRLSDLSGHSVAAGCCAFLIGAVCVGVGRSRAGKNTVGWRIIEITNEKGTMP